ncbi:MAG TPA: hypothetical protein VF841_17205 [Anaeromyxobacter sp.]
MVPSRVIIEVLGTFDEGVARAVRAALVSGVGSITVDFTHASRVYPVSLARLARELARDRTGAVAVDGLSPQQERLLRYLGAHLPASWPLEPAARA